VLFAQVLAENSVITAIPVDVVVSVGAAADCSDLKI